MTQTNDPLFDILRYIKYSNLQITALSTFLEQWESSLDNIDKISAMILAVFRNKCIGTLTNSNTI